MVSEFTTRFGLITSIFRPSRQSIGILHKFVCFCFCLFFLIILVIITTNLFTHSPQISFTLFCTACISHAKHVIIIRIYFWSTISSEHHVGVTYNKRYHIYSNQSVTPLLQASCQLVYPVRSAGKDRLTDGG